MIRCAFIPLAMVFSLTASEPEAPRLDQAVAVWAEDAPVASLVPATPDIPAADDEAAEQEALYRGAQAWLEQIAPKSRRWLP